MSPGGAGATLEHNVLQPSISRAIAGFGPLFISYRSDVAEMNILKVLKETRADQTLLQRSTGLHVELGVCVCVCVWRQALLTGKELCGQLVTARSLDTAK